MKLIEKVALLPADADTKITGTAWGAGVRNAPIPIFMPDGRFVAPGVADALESTGENLAEWRPNSHRTRLLVACAHAAKDLATCARSIRPEAGWKEKRPIALLATPLITLCDHTKDLCDRLGPEVAERAHWPRADQDLLRDAGRRLKRHKSGPLRTLRNTLTAHLDLEALASQAVPVSSLQALILPPLADTLLVLTLCFNYRRIYTWIRMPEDVPVGEVEIMTEYPVAIRATVVGGEISSLGGHSVMADDPRGPLRDTVLGLYDVYNVLASTADPPHPKIFFKPRE